VAAMTAWPSTLLGPEGTDALWSSLGLDWPLAVRPRSRAIHAGSFRQAREPGYAAV
jgi:hypothetical protein